LGAGDNSDIKSPGFRSAQDRRGCIPLRQPADRTRTPPPGRPQSVHSGALARSAHERLSACAPRHSNGMATEVTNGRPRGREGGRERLADWLTLANRERCCGPHHKSSFAPAVTRRRTRRLSNSRTTSSNGRAAATGDSQPLDRSTPDSPGETATPTTSRVATMEERIWRAMAVRPQPGLRPAG